MTIPGIYNQRDARWANILLGYNKEAAYNLYHYGCAVVGVANILWWVTGDSSWTPARVNRWLIDNHGFLAEGGLIIWGRLAELLRQYDIEYHGFSTSPGGVNTFLAPENNYALAQLTKAGFPMHFSAMPYVGQIADSWDSKLKNLAGSYTFIGAHLYTKIVRQAAPVQLPVLSPAPIQTPAVAPSVPVPSVEKPIENPNPETEIPAPAAPAVTHVPVGEVTTTPAAPEVDNAPEAPNTSGDKVPSAVLGLGKTFPITPLDRPAWVEPAEVGGAEICDMRDGTPLGRIPFGKKFQILFYSYDEVKDTHYLVTRKGADADITQGIHPSELRRTTAPLVDTIASRPADAPFEVKLDDFGTAGRTILKALHALFGDWHVFKFGKKEEK